MGRLPKNYQSNLEEFKNLSSFINRKIADSSFYELPFKERFSYIQRIKRLYSKLMGPMSDKKLKYILAAAALIVFAAGCPQQPGVSDNTEEEEETSDEITFEAYQGFPFGILGGYTYYVGGVISPILVDIDNDGDLDLYAAGYISAANYYYMGPMAVRNTSRDAMDQFYNAGITYFENTGSADSPSFAAPVNVHYSGAYQTMADFIDIDGDGDLDMVLGGYYNPGIAGIYILENSGTPTSPDFSGEGFQRTFEWIGDYTYDSGGAIVKPEFADIDNDGDYDLFLGGDISLYDFTYTYYFDHEGLVYLENTSGSADTFTFNDPVINPFSIADPGDFWFPTLEDLDKDGDLDLFLGNYDATPSTGGIKYYENTGDVDNPVFADPVIDPFGLDSLLDLDFIEFLLPEFADMDNDGDLDMFPGGYFYAGYFDGPYYAYGGPVYLENTTG